MPVRRSCLPCPPPASKRALHPAVIGINTGSQDFLPLSGSSAIKLRRFDLGRRNEGIVAQDHPHPLAADCERQLEPELHQMLLLATRAAHRSLGGLSLRCDATIVGKPLIPLVAPCEPI